MNISRATTFSLALAVAVFALGYTIPSFADNPKKGECKPKHCDHGDEPPPSGLTYTVDLRGTGTAFGIRGAFEFHPADGDSAADATLNSKGLNLDGDVAVTMKRAGNDENCTSSNDGDVNDACAVWTDLFNLCGLLGPWMGTNEDDGSGPTLLDEFTVNAGDWSVAQGGGRRTISFGFTIIPAKSNESIDRDMSGGLTLSSPCAHPDDNPSCDHDDDGLLFPITADTPENVIEHVMVNARIHLRGKKGVTHQAVCHADDDSLVIDNGMTKGSTIVITATAVE